MKHSNYNINQLLLDKRIIDMTGEEVMELMQYAVIRAYTSIEEERHFHTKQHTIVRGHKGLGKVLGLSESSIKRLVMDGIITPPAIIRSGRCISYDVDEVLKQLENQKKGGVKRLRG